MDAANGIRSRGKARGLATALLPLAIALGAIGCSLVAIAPNLSLLRHFQPNTLEWFRAHDFFLQAADPFRADVDGVMRWRLLPALVAHFAGLRGVYAQLVPWLGLVAFMTYVAAIFLRRSGDWRFAFGGALLVATTSAVTWPATFLGFNDGWVWLGLTVLAVEDALVPSLVVCLLCPWVDERFVIGAPLAWIAGRLYRGQPLFSRDLLGPAAALLFYCLARLGLSAWSGLHIEAGHVARMVRERGLATRYGPMGWWMGLRAAWVPIGLYFAWTGRSLLAGIALAATAAVTVFLTEDQSRSAAVAIPLVVLGMLALWRRYPEQATRAALALGALGLVLPAATVEDSDVSIYDNLFVELFRLWRS